MNADTMLQGKVIMITGATSGIGKGCAEHLAAQGARVVVAGRKGDVGRAVCADITAAGGMAEFQRLDVTSEDEWSTAIASVLARHGQLNGLISNAGECVLAPIETLSLEQFRFLLRVNVVGTFLALRHGMAAIRRSGGGAIAAVSSVAGIRPNAGSTIYSATKASISGLVRQAALEGRAMTPHVQVNAVYPGMIWVEGVAESLGEAAALAMRDAVVARTPLARAGTPHDIATVMALLMSGRVPSLSASPLVVDGGFSLS